MDFFYYVFIIGFVLRDLYLELKRKIPMLSQNLDPVYDHCCVIVRAVMNSNICEALNNFSRVYTDFLIERDEPGLELMFLERLARQDNMESRFWREGLFDTAIWNERFDQFEFTRMEHPF